MLARFPALSGMQFGCPVQTSQSSERVTTAEEQRSSVGLVLVFKAEGWFATEVGVTIHAAMASLRQARYERGDCLFSQG